MIIAVNNSSPITLELLGTDYGGWALDLEKIKQDSVVYSFGVGTDISFDTSLLQRKSCVIHAFDPTPRSINWISNQKLPNNFKFYDIGLSNFNGESHFNEPPHKDWVSYSETTNPKENSVKCRVEKLSTIMNRLNHNHIDLLKMDIEGSEFSVLENMYEENIFPDQILVEFHGNDINKINKTLSFFQNYNIFKRHDRPDYYLIKI